jgi:acyl-CoA synthetase (AMP-forming)/AMP-acid ligase II
MLGYWNNPEATEEALGGGWLHTGDNFQQDDEGFLHFAGRLKEMVKSGGENVYPAEVEQTLMEHPDILECAVAGVPHPFWGEAVKAFVVSRVELSPAAVIRFDGFHHSGRTSPRDGEINGVQIKEGDQVVLSTASANRDERHFDGLAPLGTPLFEPYRYGASARKDCGTAGDQAGAA